MRAAAQTDRFLRGGDAPPHGEDPVRSRLTVAKRSDLWGNVSMVESHKGVLTQCFSPRSRHFATCIGLAGLYYYFIRALGACIFLPVPWHPRVIVVSLSIVGIVLLTRMILSVPRSAVPREDKLDSRVALQRRTTLARK